MLIALLRWREPMARLAVAWACMPQTPIPYEAVPLFLIPRTWTESSVLAGLTMLVRELHRLGGPYENYGGRHECERHADALAAVHPLRVTDRATPERAEADGRT